MDLFRNTTTTEQSYWVSYTDLVTGFLIVFIIITLVLYQQVSLTTADVSTHQEMIRTQKLEIIELRKKVENITEYQQTVRKQERRIEELQQQLGGAAEAASVSQKYEELVDVFEEKLAAIEGIEISPDATVRFVLDEQSSQSLFVSPQSTPTNYFKKQLDKFIPIYLEEIQKINQSSTGLRVKELRIEGHTDSDGNYRSNLRLSSQRAVEVQRYVEKNKDFKKYEPEFRQFFRTNTIAVGYSDSRLLDGSGKLITYPKQQKEDKTKSRRVEFRVLLENQ